MLTGLKVLSWACKCVFCRPEHSAEGMGGMELNAKMKYTNGYSLKIR